MAIPSTLLLASMSLPSARRLAEVALRQRWAVHALDENPVMEVVGPRTFYGGTDRAAEYASRYGLCLIEPPLDLISRVPRELLSRTVRYGLLHQCASINGPIFVKPADPILKTFDAGVYRSVADVQGRRPLPAETPILISDPVEWTSEYRCFVLDDGGIAAWSPYLSFGRPVWKAGAAGKVPESLGIFVSRMVNLMGDALPPAFVVDVGVLEDGRWAVVEFNPAWCSGILGADVENVFKVVQRAAMAMSDASPGDRRWSR